MSGADTDADRDDTADVDGHIRANVGADLDEHHWSEPYGNANAAAYPECNALVVDVADQHGDHADEHRSTDEHADNADRHILTFEHAHRADGDATAADRGVDGDTDGVGLCW